MGYIGGCALALIFVYASGSLPAAAQSFPVKPIRVVVPIAPGGGMDTIARIMAFKIGEAFHQQVVVDNRPGAGGVIGSEMVAKSAPDGYTLLFIANPFSTNPVLNANLPFDTLRDFASVSLVATAPLLVALHPSVPARSIQELIAFAKSKPDFLSYGTSGNGSPQHIAGELFKTRAGIEYTHIPYKGGSAAIVDILSGKVQLAFAGVITILPHVKAGKLHALAVTSIKRSPVLPDLPTIAESGLKDFEVLTWYGFFARGGTPARIIKALNGAVSQALTSPDVIERLTREAHDPAPSTPEQLAAFVRAEIEKTRKLAKATSMKID
jgi:tripartite-type tricarboxylate transporter receptor subunit TctC